MKEVIQKITNSTEINQSTISLFPCVDLSTIDSLWRQYSDGKFGFSVQKEIYQQSSQNRDEFGHRTGWRIKDADGNYSWRSNSAFDYNFATTPRGHLPSSLWAGEDAIWVENRRDRLVALFARMDSCSIEKALRGGQRGFRLMGGILFSARDYAFNRATKPTQRFRQFG